MCKIVKLDTEDTVESCTEKMTNLMLSASNNSSKLVNVKPKPKLTNFYTEASYIHTYLAQTSEIGQGLGRFLSCGARKQEQT